MNTTYAQEQASLAGVLRERILDYKKARPNLSSQQIATKFGMSSSTFNRIENLDIKTPTFDQVIKVFNGTGCRGDLLAYLKGNYPEIALTYAQIYQNTEGGGYIKDEVLEHLVNPDTNKIMVLAFSKCGLSRELVKEELGNDGLRKLDFLIEKDILQKKGERYFPREGEVGVVPNQEDSKRLVELALQNFYDLSGFKNNTASNYLTYQSESINLDKVYPEIIRLLQEVNQRIREIFNNPKNEGEETVFVSLISDTVLKNDLLKRNLEKKQKGIIQ